MIKGTVILHPASSVNFVTNGLGNLSDYVEGIVVEEINGMFELTLKYPIFGVHYKDITMRRILYAKPNPYSKPQPFRIYAIGKPINGIVTINAAHISYDLSGIPVSEFEATTAADALNKIKSNSVISNPFQFNSTVTTTGTVKVQAPRSARSVLGNNVLRAYGGEYEFDNMMVYHRPKRGINRGFSIRYGKNLLDINQEENIANVYTGVYPFWIGEDEEGNKVMVKLPEKIVKVEGNFDFERILTYDVGEEYYEEPTIEQMREATLKKIKSEKIGVPSVSIDASFIQLSKSVDHKNFAMLERLELGDELDVEFMALGVSANARCIKTTYNIATDSYDKVEMGDAKSNLATTISDGQQILDETIAKQQIKFDAEIGSIKIGIADIEHVIADKVDADWVSANFAHLVNGYIDNAQIKDLNAGTITTGDLEAERIKAGVIEAINISTDTATIKAAKIEDLSADKITTGDLDAERIKAGVIEAINISADGAVIKSAKIGDLSADKIKTGTLNADRIGAGTITADKIAIGDFNNYITAKPNAERANENGVKEKCFYLKNATGYLLSEKLTTIDQGNKFQVKGTVYTVAKTGNPQFYITWRNTEGTSLDTKMVDIPNTVVGKYTPFSIELEVPTKSSLAAYCTFNMRSSSAGTGEIYVYNLAALRKSNGELIVDGSITADKIDAGAITAGKIDADAITADLIKSKVIEAINMRADTATINAAKIGNLNAEKITTGFLDAARIKAGSIDADKIAAETISAIGISAGKIVADDIAAGKIKVGDINIVDGTISFAKISNVKITTAMMDEAFIADGFIQNLDAKVIKTGTFTANRISGGVLDASKITVTNLNADSITTGSITVLGDNLLHNTDFEKGLDNYWIKDSSKPDGATVSPTTFHEGVKSVWIKTTGVNFGYTVPKMDMTARTFVASIYVKTDTGFTTNDARLMILSYNEAGTQSIISKTINLPPGSDWQRFVISGTVAEDTKQISFKFRTNGNFAGWFAKPMLSKGSIASEWKLHTDELISDGAIDNDKLGDEAVTSDKLHTDELFVGDNAFINKLKAVDIDAANITTGTISNERINIKGLINFEAFDESLQGIFNVQGNKTYINGGMIATNTIKADKIDLLSGLTVQGVNGKPVFAISRVGDTDTGTVEIDGLLKSGNFDETSGMGYQISTDGTAILNQARISGEIMLPNAGMTNYGATIGNENLVLDSAGMSEEGRSLTVIGNITGGTKLTITADFDIEGLVAGSQERIGFEGSILNDDGTRTYIGIWHYISQGTTFKGRKKITYNLQKASSDRLKSITIYTDLVDPIKTKKRFIGNIKIEMGEVDTPYCPAKADQFNYVRMWAGSNFEGRDNAPFRVYQNGDVFASNGTFSGLLRGTLDSGDVQIYNNAITIHNPGTETEVVNIAANRSKFDSDFIMGANNIVYSKGNKQLSLTGTTLDVASVSGRVIVNPDSSETGGLNILGPTEGQHVIRGSTTIEKTGALFFDSQGASSPYGDFVFVRKNQREDVKVKIDGELNVKTKINTPANGIELRFESDGWGFYAI